MRYPRVSSLTTFLLLLAATPLLIGCAESDTEKRTVEVSFAERVDPDGSATVSVKVIPLEYWEGTLTSSQQVDVDAQVTLNGTELVLDDDEPRHQEKFRLEDAPVLRGEPNEVLVKMSNGHLYRYWVNYPDVALTGFPDQQELAVGDTIRLRWNNPRTIEGTPGTLVLFDRRAYNDLDGISSANGFTILEYVVPSAFQGLRPFAQFSYAWKQRPRGTFIRVRGSYTCTGDIPIQ